MGGRRRCHACLQRARVYDAMLCRCDISYLGSRDHKVCCCLFFVAPSGWPARDGWFSLTLPPPPAPPIFTPFRCDDEGWVTVSRGVVPAMAAGGLSGSLSDRSQRVLTQVLLALAGDPELAVELRTVLDSEAASSSSVGGRGWMGALLAAFVWVFRTVLVLGAVAGVAFVLHRTGALTKARQSVAAVLRPAAPVTGGTEAITSAGPGSSDGARRAFPSPPANEGTERLRQDLASAQDRLHAAALREIALKQSLMAQLDVAESALAKAGAAEQAEQEASAVRAALVAAERSLADVTVYAASLEQSVWDLANALSSSAAGRTTTSSSRSLSPPPASDRKSTRELVELLGDRERDVARLSSENASLLKDCESLRGRIRQLEWDAQRSAIVALSTASAASTPRRT